MPVAVTYLNTPALARLASHCALIAGVTLITTLNAAAAGLTAPEKKIVAAATAEVAAAQALLERLVNINSGTMNFAGVEQTGRIMITELQGLGFEARWVPMSGVNRAGHVVAEHKGSGRG